MVFKSVNLVDFLTWLTKFPLCSRFRACAPRRQASSIFPKVPEVPDSSELSELPGLPELPEVEEVEEKFAGVKVFRSFKASQRPRP
jgi:hypothetical protein